MKLTRKQQRFVEEYLIDLNATQASIRAGYSERTAKSIGQRLLTFVDVQESIEKAMDKRSRRTEITADRVLQEYAKIGFSNITDYLRVKNIEVEGNGIQTVEFFETDNIDRSRMDAVAEIKQTRDGIALKLHDKKGALDSIARHLGMFNDRVDISGGMNNTTQDLTGMTPEERRARIDELNRRRRDGTA